MRTRDRHDNDNVRRIFEAIARDTIDNNGGTYQHKTGAKIHRAEGYYVGIGNVATVDIDIITTPVLAGILADVWPRTLPARSQYVGTWISGDRLYVDYIVHIPGTDNLDVALACARRHGELAVWDCKNGVAVDVPIITDARECFADIDPNAAALEVGDLIAELHEAVFGDESTFEVLRTIVYDALTSTDADDFDREPRERLISAIDRHTWIVERLRVLTDSEYAECAYGADDDDD